MAYIRCLLLLIFVSLPISSDAQSWLWAKRLPFRYCAAVTGDNAGNIYVTGQTDTSLIIGYDTRINHGSFITKYNASGGEIWTKTFWGAQPTTIVTDTLGHVFLAGTYFDSALLWDGHFLSNSLPRLRWAAFVAMLDSSGTCIWIKGDSSVENCSPSKLVLDPTGYIYLSGSAMGVTKFGSFSIPHYGSHIQVNSILVKYNLSGEVIWAVGGTSGDGRSLAIDKWGNVYQSGYLPDNSLTFGSLTCIPDPLPGGDYGGYVARFDANGNAVWIRARKDGILYSEWFVAVDGQGSVYVTDNYNSARIIGTDTLNVEPGNYNMEVVKYSSSGDALAARGAGNLRWVRPRDIAIDKWGNIFISGHAAPGTTTDSFQFDTFSIACTHNYVPFLVKYNKCGDAVYATVPSNDTLNYSGVNSIFSVDSSVYVLGNYGNYGITFGEQTLSNTYRGNDCFLAKLGNKSGSADCAAMAVSEIRALHDVKFFPNPASSKVTIKSEDEIHSLVVYDPPGKTIYKHISRNTTSIEIDVSEWQPGLYFVRINDVVIKRFLKD